MGPLLKPSEAAPGSRDNGAGAKDSRLVKASQAEAGPGASAPQRLEPAAADAADEKFQQPCEDPNDCALDCSIWKRF